MSQGGHNTEREQEALSPAGPRKPHRSPIEISADRGIRMVEGEPVGESGRAHVVVPISETTRNGGLILSLRQTTANTPIKGRKLID